MVRWLFRLVALVLALPVLYLLAALAGALIPGGGGAVEGPATVRIGLLRGPIHYDFLLPVDERTRRAFAFAEVQRGVPVSHPQARWIVVGWGSEAFYTTAGSYADITAAAVWTAATGDDAVMRVDVLSEFSQEVEGLYWLDLTPEEYSRLLYGIETSFLRDLGGRPHPLEAPGLTGSDGFWRATGHFSLLHPCNDWVGQQLREAGLPFGRWTPTPQAVTLAIWWHLPSSAG